MMRRVGLAGVLFGFWLLLSGHYTGFLVTAGAFACAGVVVLVHSMDVVDDEGQPFHLIGRAFFYWPWLLIEIVKSGLQVARIILDPKLPISPAMRKVAASQKTGLGRNLFANSITLTPGTISVGIDDHHILVHALEASSLDDLDEGEMDRRASEFEGAS